MDRLVIFAGTANPALAARVARELGAELGRCAVERFPDGELGVHLGEPIAGAEVVLVQPTTPPVNDNLLELLVFADACRRAEAARITAVVPYFGYARADSRHGRGDPVTARLVAELIETAGIARLITVDAHTPQLEGFFHIPFYDVSAVEMLCNALQDRIPDDAVVVSPDLGRVRTAAEVGRRFGLPVAALHKQRTSGEAVASVQLIGAVEGRSCLIIDDMISTGRTIVEAVRALERARAKPEFLVAATHGVLVDGARQTLTDAGVREVWITDTIAGRQEDWTALRVISIAALLARTLLEALQGGPSGRRDSAGPARPASPQRRRR